MAKTSINNLKNWFKNGLKPAQEHFWNWLDSYWHKDDKIPLSSIDSLEDRFSEKSDAEALENHLVDDNAHDLVEKLSLKTDNTVFENHLNDENAHGLFDKLALKADVSWATEISDRLDTHIEDENAHGLVEKLAVKADKEHKHEIADVTGLTEALADAGKVKTVNSIEPDENGNIEISTTDDSKLPLDGSKPMGGTLTLNKGTTTEAPLVVPKGELLTVPVDGTIERDNSGILYNTVGSDRYQIYDSSTPLFRTIYTSRQVYNSHNTQISDVNVGGARADIIRGTLKPNSSYMIPLMVTSSPDKGRNDGINPEKIIHRLELSIPNGRFIKRNVDLNKLLLYEREFTDIINDNYLTTAMIIINISSTINATGGLKYNQITFAGVKVDNDGNVSQTNYSNLCLVQGTPPNNFNGNVEINEIDLRFSPVIETIYADANNEQGLNKQSLQTLNAHTIKIIEM